MKDITKRKYSIGDLLGSAWEIYTKHFKLLASLVLLFYIPIAVLAAYFGLPLAADAFAGKVVAGYQHGINLLFALLGVWFTLALAYGVDILRKGKTISLQEMLSFSGKRFGAALWTYVVFVVLIVLLFLLLIVPGIIFTIYWLFFLFVVLFHNKSGKAALDHSKALVKGRWWRTLGFVIVFAILSSIITGIFSGILSAAGNNIIATVLLNIVSMVASTYFTVAYVLFFINMDNVPVEESQQKP